jgi:hypothetical protein
MDISQRGGWRVIWKDLHMINRHYQGLACRISPDEKSRMGGAEAKRRGGDPTCREFTGDDRLNPTRMRGAAAAFRACLGGLAAGPYHGWATPHKPSLASL